MSKPRATESELRTVIEYLFGTCETRHRWALPIVNTKIDWHYEAFQRWAKRYGKQTMTRVAFRHGLKRAHPVHVEGDWTRNVCMLKPQCWTDGSVQAVWDGEL